MYRNTKEKGETQDGMLQFRTSRGKTKAFRAENERRSGLEHPLGWPYEFKSWSHIQLGN